MTPQLQPLYDKIAEAAVESLEDGGLDLDLFLPVLHRAIAARCRDIRTNAADYEPDSWAWAEHQERISKLALDGLREVIGELDCAISQSTSADDQILVGHMQVSSALLKSQSRLMQQ